jgi:hypothetical protein
LPSAAAAAAIASYGETSVAVRNDDVVVVRELGEPLRVRVDDRDRVLVVQRLDDRRADLGGADDRECHGGRLPPPLPDRPTSRYR